jgi:hypothetical protein
MKIDVTFRQSVVHTTTADKSQFMVAKQGFEAYLLIPEYRAGLLDELGARPKHPYHHQIHRICMEPPLTGLDGA